MSTALTEAQEAKLVVAYLRRLGIMFMHVPSETGSDMAARRRAVRMKQQGTVKGFPDYIVIVNGRVIGIELKRSVGGRVSPEQRAWIAALNDAGLEARVCKGFEEVRAFVDEVLNPQRELAAA